MGEFGAVKVAPVPPYGQSVSSKRVEDDSAENMKTSSGMLDGVRALNALETVRSITNRTSFDASSHRAWGPGCRRRNTTKGRVDIYSTTPVRSSLSITFGFIFYFTCHSNIG